jgi:hypothetical protein
MNRSIFMFSVFYNVLFYQFLIIIGNEKIGKEMLVQNCLFMLVAGDTTPCAVISFLYYMCVNLDVQKNLIEEIKTNIRTEVCCNFSFRTCVYFSNSFLKLL